MNNCGTSFAVRFLKNGDYIRVFTNITKENNSGTSLFQVIDQTSGAIVPDWTVAANQPIITFEALSTVGYPVEISEISFGYNGNNLSFGNLTESWQEDLNGLGFSARMNGKRPQLRITKNLAALNTEEGNRQINYSLTYKSNGMVDTVKGTLDVIIQASGESCFSLMIETSRSVLDSVNTQTTLIASAMYGPNAVEIGKDGYRVEWFQGQTPVTGDVTPGQLTVTRDMVEGGSVFVAKLYKGEDLVAQDSQRINDIADTYQVRYTPVGPDYVSPTTSASFELSVWKNNQPLSTDVAVEYTWDIYNAIGVVTKAGGTGSTVIVETENCKVAGDTEQNSVAYYSGVDVNVTASFN